jgi:hypothetical protein
LQFRLDDIAKAHSISHFTSSNLIAYDITQSLLPSKLSNVSITTSDGGLTYATHFFADDSADSDNSKNYVFLPADSVYRPSNLSLNSGIDDSLKSNTNQADLIIIGREELLEAMDDYLAHRRSQGLIVRTLTPDQIFGEFSFGIKNSKAIKDFLMTAVKTWSKAPKYALILGDATLDPLDYNVKNLSSSNRSALDVGTMPIPLVSGRFMDFGSDQFFATDDITKLPLLSIGRLPTNNPDILKSYTDKVIRYENGFSSPMLNVKKISFFADEETGQYEKFDQLSQLMINEVLSFNTTFTDRTLLGSDSLTKAKVIDDFNSSPLFISMIGHGAFDRFGNDILTTTDARSLTNTKLPIVMSWNCESAFYFDADKTYKSLGEELIFNENGGAIAYLGSTTQTTPPAQAKLAQMFFGQLNNLVQKPWDGSRLGDVLYLAKIGVGAGSYEQDILMSYSIIGDPSLKLPEEIFAPAASGTIVPPPAAQIESKSNGFGCSLFANESATHSTHFFDGLFEFVLYLSLMVFGYRFKRKMS